MPSEINMSGGGDHEQNHELMTALGSLKQYDSNGLTEMVRKLQAEKKELTEEDLKLMLQGEAPRFMQAPNMAQLPDTVNLQQLATVATSNAITTHDTDEPYLEIVEQPKSKGIRFRYKCEGRSAGSIPGESSSNEHKTYPSVRINNFKDQAAIVVVSCVTKEEPYRPHPHTLVGKECRKGVCTIKLKRSNVATFPNLGIQCVTKKEIKDSLVEREQIRVDPFGTGYYSDLPKLQLNIVRLCFQAFLPDEEGKYTRIVPPVISQAIYDKKAVNDLVVCRLSKQSGSAKGGDDVFMLCEKVNKDDIQVRFYEEIEEEIVWEAYAEFSQVDVHRQFAIVFRTPPYKDQYINHPREVHMQLFRPSDEGTSEPKSFQYIPNDPDPDQIARKRRRKNLLIPEVNPNTPAFNLLTDTVKDDHDAPRTANHLVRQRLRAKVTKTEPQMAPMQYTLATGVPVTYQGGTMIPGEVIIDEAEIQHVEEVQYTAAAALTELGVHQIEGGHNVVIVQPQEDEEDDVMLENLPIGRDIGEKIEVIDDSARLDSSTLPSLSNIPDVQMEDSLIKEITRDRLNMDPQSTSKMSTRHKKGKD